MKYYKMMYNGQHNDVDNWINCIKPDIKNNEICTFRIQTYHKLANT